jgi:SAM-dependent methyltransferase
MKTKLLDLMCCPKCKSDLTVVKHGQNGSETNALACGYCGKSFATKHDFVHFIAEDEVLRFNKRVEFWRSINARFYTPLTNFMFLPCGGAFNARKEVLDHLEIKPGSKILETGIGTGDNILFLKEQLDGGTFYGLDNQMRMLDKCACNCAKWKLKAELCRADAEYLPYKDCTFDVVFHLGAINLFQNKKQAIDEMIRVAKPGTKIVIADETEKASKLFAIFQGKTDPVIPPIDLVPATMLQKKLEIIWKGYGYLITFRKPEQHDMLKPEL